MVINEDKKESSESQTKDSANSESSDLVKEETKAKDTELPPNEGVKILEQVFAT